jgi:uncharacterized protein (DUF305 family)
MKKTTFVILSIALIVLLGLAAYGVLLIFGNSTVQPCCPFAENTQLFNQSEPGTGRGFGMMGPGMMGRGMMGPGMMGSMNVFVDSEYEFLVHMIPHHEEAVETATILKANTEREEMRDFAEGIIRTQSAEIEQMTTWLENWYPDRSHHVDYQPMMRDLEKLKGDALDRAFLEDMIPHHMTAIMMSQQLLNRGLAEHEEVEVLARSIRNSQSNEIQMMINWLDNWGRFTPSPVTRNWAALIWIGVIAFVVFIAVVILLVIVLKAGYFSTASTANQAQEILKKRYAKGEITREEYLRTHDDLR